MSQTSWQERRDFEARLHDGQNLTAQETQLLGLRDSASAKLETLRLGLEFAVPFRIEELRRYTFEQRAILAEETAQIITEKGDAILFRSKRKGNTAAAFNALVTGLACLAFQPGGVRQFGLHFEVKT